jgi:hypothetical protein
MNNQQFLQLAIDKINSSVHQKRKFYNGKKTTLYIDYAIGEAPPEANKCHEIVIIPTSGYVPVQGVVWNIGGQVTANNLRGEQIIKQHIESRFDIQPVNQFFVINYHGLVHIDIYTGYPTFGDDTRYSPMYVMRDCCGIYSVDNNIDICRSCGKAIIQDTFIFSCDTSFAPTDQLLLPLSQNVMKAFRSEIMEMVTDN